MSPAAAGQVVIPAHAHLGEQIRDIPAGCICKWRWQAGRREYARIEQAAGCPWHDTEGDKSNG